PEAVLHPEGAVHQRVMLLRGSGLEPDPPQPLPGAELRPGEVGGVVPQEPAVPGGSVGDADRHHHRGDEEPLSWSNGMSRSVLGDDQGYFFIFATNSSCAFFISAGLKSFTCFASTHWVPQRSCSSAMRSPQNMSPGGITTLSPALFARSKPRSTSS